MKKVGVYLRVSDGNQTPNGTRAQRQAAKQWADSNHIPSGDMTWYEDQKSGSTTDRPALNRMLRAVARGKVDVVVVFRLDRLARSLRDGLNILADLAERGIRVVSISEGIDFNSSTGKLVASILLSVASFERESIRERSMAGIRAAKQNGIHCGRPRNDKKLIQIRRMYNAGVTAQTIADRLRCTRSNVYAALGKTKELEQTQTNT